MTILKTLTFDFLLAQKQVQEFAALLKANPILDEKKTLLPFFRHREQLSALCSVYNPYVGIPDRIEWEFGIFGDFRCDLIVGKWANSYCFIEFEDAGPKSIFEKKGKKLTLEWATRFEHGFSQVVDWFYKLAGRMDSPEFEVAFGKRSVRYEGVLVIGRDQYLDLSERQRLEWRRTNLILNSKQIHCVTFDELLGAMNHRLETMLLTRSGKKKNKS